MSSLRSMMNPGAPASDTVSVEVSTKTKDTAADVNKNQHLWTDQGSGKLLDEQIKPCATKDKVQQQGAGIPSDWQEGARAQRISELDAQCATFYGEEDGSVSRPLDATKLLMPGERIVDQLDCLGFVGGTFGHTGVDFEGGECQLVLTERKDGGGAPGSLARSLFLVQNRQERTLSVKEDYSHTRVSGCCIKNREMSKTSRDYTVTRDGYSSFGIIAVEDQLVNMYSETVTKTKLEASQAAAAETEQKPQKCCPDCGCPCSCICSICVDLCKGLCKCCAPKIEHNQSEFELEAESRPLALEDIVAARKTITQQASAVGQDTTRTTSRYYGLNIQYADPAHARLAECVAVVKPGVGKQAVASFIRHSMHFGATRQQQGARQKFSDLGSPDRKLRAHALSGPADATTLNFKALAASRGGKVPQCVIS